MVDPSKKYFFLVLSLEIAIMVLQILALRKDTLWYCDLTSRVPAKNVTGNSIHDVAISIKVRTTVEKRCWYAKQAEESSTVNYALIDAPITKCLTMKSVGLTRDTRKAIKESNSGKRSQMLYLGLHITLLNIWL